MKWWQNRDFEKYTDIITKINYSKENSLEWISKCKSLFDALNNLWTDLFIYRKENNLLNNDELKGWSDHKAFYELLISLNPASKKSNYWLIGT